MGCIIAPQNGPGRPTSSMYEAAEGSSVREEIGTGLLRDFRLLRSGAWLQDWYRAVLTRDERGRREARCGVLIASRPRIAEPVLSPPCTDSPSDAFRSIKQANL